MLRCGVPGVLALAVAAPAAAAPSASLVVWAGSLRAHEPLHGVSLGASGSGQRLRINAANRAKGTVTVAGGFAPSSAKLAAIRAAALGAMAGPAFAGGGSADGNYAVATIQQGGSRAATLGIDDESPGLRKLVDALNAALPAGSRLAHPSAVAGASALHPFEGARGARAPTPAPCPGPGGGQSEGATTIYKQLDLRDAADLRVATLTSKGGFEGDTMAVDATYKNVPALTHVRLNVEVTPPDNSRDWAQFVRDNAGFGPLGEPAPTPGEPNNRVLFDLNVKVRAPGAPKTPCYHEIALRDYSKLKPDDRPRSYVTNVGLSGPQGGEWDVADPQAFKHELLHLAGLEDQYDDHFVTASGKDYPLPEGKSDGQDLVAQLAKLGLNKSQGGVRSVPRPGHENDIMALIDGQLQGSDAQFLASLAGILLTDSPGDLLGNKDGTAQNLVTGSNFRLFVPQGGNAHANGIVTYCTDLHRHVPKEGIRFDVLGPAGEHPEPGMQALARLMPVVAAHQAEPLQPTQGAQDAVWRVTDDTPPTGQGQALLLEAGVNPDPETQTYSSPHFNDPNAGSPETAGISASGTIDPTLPSLPPDPLAVAHFTKLRLLGGAPRARQPHTLLVLDFELSGPGQSIRLELLRKLGRRFLRFAEVSTLSLPHGRSELLVAVRPLPAGSYRLLATAGSGERRSVSFSAR
jgi:hypothetical protein